jgi:hypothetical protein
VNRRTRKPQTAVHWILLRLSRYATSPEMLAHEMADAAAQTVTNMKAAESHRSELISRIDLRVVGDGAGG